MGADRSTSDISPMRSVLGRGALFFAGLGCLIGGIVGTLQWPVVATFFGAAEGAAAGAVAGVLAGAALAVLAGWTRSRWAARGVAAVIAGAAGLTVEIARTAPFVMPRAGAIAVVGAAALLAGVLGPLIAYGAEPVTVGRRAVAAGPVLRRFLGWGLGLGAGLGAATGLVVGIWAYLPTAPVAAVEGAFLGMVSGLFLACLAAAVVLLPGVRARR